MPLVSLITTINAWNTLGASTHAWEPGSYEPMAADPSAPGVHRLTHRLVFTAAVAVLVFMYSFWHWQRFWSGSSGPPGRSSYHTP